MTGSLTVMVIAAVLVVIGFLAVLVVPQLAHSRLILELSKIRSVIEDLATEDSGFATHPDVQMVDHLVASILSMGRPPGMSALISAVIEMQRDRKAGRLSPGPTFAGLTTSQRVSMHFLLQRTGLEVVRASFLGSSVWFLVFPVWLAIRAGVRYQESLQRGANDDGNLTQVVTLGAGFAAPLQHA